MERIFDLNGRDASSVAVIKLRDKTFRISRIVVGVRVLYSNYLKQLSNLFTDLGKAENLEDKTVQEQLQERYEKFAEDVPDILRSCIRLLLEKNDLKYDPLWWEEETDVEDMRNFIDAALAKDSKSSSGVKKK